MQLVSSDRGLQEAIQRELDGSRREAEGRRRDPSGSLEHLRTLTENRRQLLELHYAGQISGELFADEERRLTVQIDALTAEKASTEAEHERSTDVQTRFEEVAALLADIDIGTLWGAATEDEQRALIDELLDGIDVHPDHLEVTVRGAPRLNLTLEEVGLNGPSADWWCRRNARS